MSHCALPSLPLLLQTLRHRNGRPCTPQQRIRSLRHPSVLAMVLIVPFLHMRPLSLDHFLQRCERADERGVFLDGFGEVRMGAGLLVHGGMDGFVGDVVCFEGAVEGEL